MQESNLFATFQKQFHDNKLGHAFLLETNQFDESLKKVLEIVKLINCPNNYCCNCQDCNLCHLIETRQLPSLIFIEPDNQTIKKEQIINLKKQFSTKPIFSKYNIYIILHAEYLNASSANAMLKFLEEPEEHIIGFFLTNNKENVINTIKSRCQILTDFAFNNVEEANEELYQDAIAFIKEYEITHEDTIFYCKNNMSTLIKDRSNFILFFQSVYSIYELLYFVKLGICSLDEKNLDLAFLLEKRSVDYFYSQINYIQKFLIDLQYNVNLQLILERFILESR